MGGLELFFIGYVTICSNDLLRCKEYDYEVWRVGRMDTEPLKKACITWKNMILTTSEIPDTKVLMGKCYLGLLSDVEER